MLFLPRALLILILTCLKDIAPADNQLTDSPGRQLINSCFIPRQRSYLSVRHRIGVAVSNTVLDPGSTIDQREQTPRIGFAGGDAGVVSMTYDGNSQIHVVVHVSLGATLVSGLEKLQILCWR